MPYSKKYVRPRRARKPRRRFNKRRMYKRASRVPRGVSVYSNFKRVTHQRLCGTLSLTGTSGALATFSLSANGPSGTGKTRKAMEAGAVQIEWDGKFMNNYNGEDVVVFDEFEWQMMPRTTFFRLTDRYPMVVTVKGGYRNWKPRIIYITTNDMNPQVWYGGHQAYLRRVKFEYVGKPDVVIGNTNGYDHN